MLAGRTWQRKYTSEDGNLVRLFYVPVLEDAERYDRLTGYFNAQALTLAARGIEGLVRNGGRMRLVVGCTLPQAEIEAIERGAKLREQVEQRLTQLTLAPPDQDAADALELLAWMVGSGHLDVKVAVPCDAQRRPIPEDGIFHEKTGIVTDRAGDTLAWTGSINETQAGWRYNYESISVFTSWGPEPARVLDEEASFARLWADQAQRVIVLDTPEALRRDLLRYLPKDDKPARLHKDEPEPPPVVPPPPPPPPPPVDLRRRVWAFLRRAPTLPNGGEQVGEATAAVTPWPHQVRAFQRLYARWPPRLLIADEVGLGKTIQAGLLLRQAWLAGRAKRILILAPKAVLRQWQIELREKFNLNWPIYDGRELVRYPSPAVRGYERRAVDADTWHEEPVVIASSQLLRRRERAQVLLEDAAPWDLVVLDEAHHARRRAAGSAKEGGPNALLKLMQGLSERTDGLLLLTATPMQVHPVEVWDLLNLLGLPPDWTPEAFLRFFEDIEEPSPSHEALERMARLFRAAEQHFGPAAAGDVERMTKLSPLRASRVLKALRERAGIPRRQLETPERRAALKVMRSQTPVRHLVSRHTRELLRRYHDAGLLQTPIAERQVEDRLVTMTAGERALYDAVEDYISTTWNQASPDERTAVGFVMTVYRRRLASSFQALRATLERRRDAAMGKGTVEASSTGFTPLDDDVSDDETSEIGQDADEVSALAYRAPSSGEAAAEETADIGALLDHIGQLPPDSKVEELEEVIDTLRGAGFQQAMVFTQFTDTMDFLRERLAGGDLRLMCFSGRGGEAPGAGGEWSEIGRDEVKRRFREGEADLLLCTDAAAEGLNFQFCGALINYDMPWNPMKVEQRIGRIDRLGQEHSTIRIVNLHYADTVETDVYQALRSRIHLFQAVVGPLQPILAKLSGAIAGAVLAGGDGRAEVVESIERQVQAAGGGFDIDASVDTEVTLPDRAPSPVALEDIDRVLGSADLLPPGTDIQPLGRREYGLLAPGMGERLRVTTDPDYYEQHAESVELWSPGNPLYTPPDFVAQADEEFPEGTTLAALLDDSHRPKTASPRQDD